MTVICLEGVQPSEAGMNKQAVSSMWVPSGSARWEQPARQPTRGLQRSPARSKSGAGRLAGQGSRSRRSGNAASDPRLSRVFRPADTQGPATPGARVAASERVFSLVCASLPTITNQHFLAIIPRMTGRGVKNDRRAVGGVTLPRPPACLTFSHEAMDLLWEVGRRRDLPAFSVQGTEKFD